MTMPKWLKDAGPESDIVISSRIRIARNVKGYLFPPYLDKGKSMEIVENVYHGIIQGNEKLQEQFNIVYIKNLTKIERLNYIEKHLISPDLANNTGVGAFILNTEETVTMMINEEDHIRIQCLLPGFQLESAWDLGNKIDDLIEERVDYSFDENFGYLTACPTNVGTGIRVSVMVHLPALSITGYINGVLQAASQIGLAIRGIYGEGTEYLGNIYQISNQVTLGATEEEILNNIRGVILQIIHKERVARQNLVQVRRIELEDRVFRSLGILKNARIITSTEAMQLISDVKLGMNLNLIQEISQEKMNQLVTMIQPGHLQKHFNRELNGTERDIKRAELIRQIL